MELNLLLPVCAFTAEQGKLHFSIFSLQSFSINLNIFCLDWAMYKCIIPVISVITRLVVSTYFEVILQSS